MKDPSAIGFRVKTGWAATVLLEGPIDAPVVLDHRHLQLSDPKVPESRQPYHAGFGTSQTDARTIARLQGLVERFALDSLTRTFRDYRAIAGKPQAVGVVVGSLLDPETIGNQHMRAHAREGRLYRSLVEGALSRQGLPARVIVERQLYETAERELGIATADLRTLLQSLRPAGPGPWRAEEKTATLAAWLALASTTLLIDRSLPRDARSGRRARRGRPG